MGDLKPNVYIIDLLLISALTVIKLFNCSKFQFIYKYIRYNKIKTVVFLEDLRRCIGESPQKRPNTQHMPQKYRLSSFSSFPEPL